MPYDELKKAKIIPLITIEKMELLVPLLEALVEAGARAIEITLRTSIAWEALEISRKRFPDLTLGAGTFTKEEDFTRAEHIGVDFGVSPGISPALLEAAQNSALFFLPGVSTVSEIMRAREAGFHKLKFFPAESFGGIKTMKAYGAIFPEVCWWPTGGLNSDNLQQYLALPNVFAVGASWFCSRALIDQKEWHQIAQRTRSAMRQVTQS